MISGRSYTPAMSETQDRRGEPARAGLAARLRTVRRRAFVGRQSERELFRSALAADVPPFAVLHVHGPGGIGKTALLDQLVEDARGAGWDPARLDGREVQPSPAGFQTALAATLDVGPDEAVPALQARDRLVLLLDTYELLAPIDGWLRDTLIPQLPRHAIVVVASRTPPATGWRADPAWAELLRVVALRDLRADEARALLEARGVDPSLCDDVLGVARGHPLALALVADVVPDQDPGQPFALEDSPQVIEDLLARLLRHVPGDSHRRTLYAAAQSGVATETLVRETVDQAAAGELFGWLCELSFTEPVAEGVAVHDLVSDALNAELRWRDPDAWGEIHEDVSRHLERRVTRTTGADQQRAMLDVIQLYRLHPLTRSFFDWGRSKQLWMDPAAPADHAEIEALAQEHEGGESARIVHYWLDRQPEAFTVFRGPDSRVDGFVAHLLLGDAPGDEVEVDPVVAAAWGHVREHAPLRRGERVRVMRFWIDHENYQGVPTHHLVSSRSSLDWIGTDRLAWSFVVLADPNFFEPIFAFIDFARPSELEVDVGPRRYGMFARDFRATSRRAWRDLLRDRRLRAREPDGPSTEAADRLLVLPQEDFAEAVRDALRGVARPGGLDDSPLLRSRVVREHADSPSPPEVLAQLLHDVVGELDQNPRDQKKQRALELAYLHPAPTQEAAAERLDLPFSTYRRHLTGGVEHVVSRLWDLELHGRDPHHPGTP